MKLSALVAILFITNTAIADSERIDQFKGVRDVGNGGDVVVCKKDGAITKVTLLDYYEAEKMRGIKINLGDPSLSVEEKLAIALNRLSRVSPDRYELYSGWLRTFDSEKSEPENVTLVDVPDSKHIVLENGCSVEQLVIQQEPQFPEDKRYIINRDLEALLDNDQLAGAKLHEVIYREAISHGHVNSIATRYFNALISSEKIEALSPLEFMHLISERMGFYGIRYNGLNIATRSSTFHKNGDLESAILTAKSSYVFNGISFPVAGTVKLYPGGQPEVIGLYDSIDFVVNGKTYKIGPARALTFHNTFVPVEIDIEKDADFKVGDVTIPVVKGSHLTFYENGNVEKTSNGKISVWKHKFGDLFLDQERIRYSWLSYLEFHSNGELRRAWLKEEAVTRLKTPNFDFCASQGGHVTFYDNGNLYDVVRKDKDPCGVLVAKVGGQIFKLSKSNSLSFHNTGVPKLIEPPEDEIQVTIQDKKVDIDTRRSGINFHPNEGIEQVLLAQDVSLVTCNGNLVNFKDGNYIELDPSGYVVRSKVQIEPSFWGDKYVSGPWTEYCPEKAKK